jgi:formyl-CoA transferase
VPDAPTGPLAGRRVVSIAQQLPGPYCGLLLADLGAEVINVEQVQGGDPARVFPALFAAANRGKASVALNLKDPRGQAAFTKLAQTADVILEGFRPGVAARLGVDYPSVARPGLVYCSISGYGQDGPAAGLPGHDLSYQAWAGALSPDGGLMPSPLPVADLSSALYATVGILAALTDPRAPGCYLDVSMAESVLAFNTVGIASAQAPAEEEQLGEPAYGVFATADDPITVSIAHEDHFWQALCGLLDWPELAGLTGAERRAQRTQLHEQLAAVLRTRPAVVWLEQFTAAGIPAGPVNTPRSTLSDPLFTTREAFVTVDGRTLPRTPLRYGGRPLPVAGSAAPALGADTVHYLTELGYSAADLDTLRTEGVVAVAQVPA